MVSRSRMLRIPRGWHIMRGLRTSPRTSPRRQSAPAPAVLVGVARCTLDRSEVLANLASIERVPAAILPHGSQARLALLALAGVARLDCYAYASGGEQTGTWCAWLQPLADARPGSRDGRVALAEWVTRWRDLLAEMGYADVTGPAPQAPEGEVRP